MKKNVFFPMLITMFMLIPVMLVCQEPDIRISEKAGKQTTYAPKSKGLYYGHFDYPSDEPAVTSQYFTDLPPYLCLAADDFIVPYNEIWNIDQIFVSGQYSTGGGPASSAHLFIYQNMTQTPGLIHLEFIDFDVTAIPEWDTFDLALKSFKI